MEHDKFDIRFDPALNLMHVTMRGHWTVETVGIYGRALKRATAEFFAVGGRRDELLALVDARELGAQSQEAVATYKEKLGGEELAPKRLATLVSSALFKRQVERIGISNQRLFTDASEAMAWLASGDDV